MSANIPSRNLVIMLKLNKQVHFMNRGYKINSVTETRKNTVTLSKSRIAIT